MQAKTRVSPILYGSFAVRINFSSAGRDSISLWIAGAHEKGRPRPPTKTPQSSRGLDLAHRRINTNKPRLLSLPPEVLMLPSKDEVRTMILPSWLAYPEMVSPGPVIVTTPEGVTL